MIKEITIMTNEGEIKTQAEEVLPGLFLHKRIIQNGEPTSQHRYSLTAQCGLSLYRDIRAPKRQIITWAQEFLSGFNWENVDNLNLSQKDKTRLIDVKADAPFPVYF